MVCRIYYVFLIIHSILMKLVAYKVISTIYITISVHHLKKKQKKNQSNSILQISQLQINLEVNPSAA